MQRTLFPLGVYIALRSSRWYTPDTHVSRLTFQHCPTVAPSLASRRRRNWCQVSSREMTSCFTVACQPGVSVGVKTDENYWARCLDTIGRAVRNFNAVTPWQVTSSVGSVGPSVSHAHPHHTSLWTTCNYPGVKSMVWGKQDSTL
jgi:hypothetical protein